MHVFLIAQRSARRNTPLAHSRTPHLRTITGACSHGAATPPRKPLVKSLLQTRYLCSLSSLLQPLSTAFGRRDQERCRHEARTYGPRLHCGCHVAGGHCLRRQGQTSRHFDGDSPVHLRSTALTASGTMLVQAPAAVRMMNPRPVHAYSASARSFYITDHVLSHGERANERMIAADPQCGHILGQNRETLYRAPSRLVM